MSEASKASDSYVPASLRERFPVGVCVEDRKQRVGRVAGYDSGKVLVAEMDASKLAFDPEDIRLCHPRPLRHDLLKAVEDAIVSAAKRGDGASVLALAQARALL